MYVGTQALIEIQSTIMSFIPQRRPARALGPYPRCDRASRQRPPSARRPHRSERPRLALSHSCPLAWMEESTRKGKHGRPVIGLQ